MNNLAAVAYEAYRANSGGKSLVSGQPIPEFEKLKPEIQEAWEAAAYAVEAQVRHAVLNEQMLRKL